MKQGFTRSISSLQFYSFNGSSHPQEPGVMPSRELAGGSSQFFAMRLQRRWTVMLPSLGCFSTFLCFLYDHILVNTMGYRCETFDCSLHIQILLLLYPYDPFNEAFPEYRGQHKSEQLLKERDWKRNSGLRLQYAC